MSTTIDLLGRQHQDVLQRLQLIDGGPPPSNDQVADVIRYLEDEVMRHFDLEERALFPVLARHIGDAQGPLAVMNAEHATFRQLLASLTAAFHSEDLDQQQRCMRDLVALLHAHIAKEDQVLFPLALQMLSPQEIGEVDAGLAS